MIVDADAATATPDDKLYANPLFGDQETGAATSVRYLSEVAEVEVSKAGEIRVHRIVCAVDCGTVVNPDTVKAQMEGGIIFGISGALWGEVTIEKGRVQQSNFHDVRTLRINEAPAIEVHLVRNFEKPGGIGEPGTAVTAPALANAVFAATGKRIRKLPLEKQLRSA